MSSARAGSGSLGSKRVAPKNETGLLWRAEQDLYAEKLKKAGVSVEVFRSPNGHLGPDGALATKVGIPTLTAAGKAIKLAFGR